MPRAIAHRRPPWTVVSLILLALALAAGCGDDDSQRPDAGQPGVHRLVILTPPGASIGLAPGEPRALRVQYLDPMDRPVSDAQVGFAIQGNAGGAILAGFNAYSDESGTAEMLLTAGAEAAAFTVTVTAPHALAVTFEVAVSEAGFTAIEGEPSYRGGRTLADFADVVVELRFDHLCEDQAPTGGSPPDRRRTVGTFGSLAVFENLPVDVGYAVTVRGEDAGGLPLAWGCADVTAGQLIRGVTVRLHLAATDVTVSPTGTWELLTALVLPSDVQGELRAPWDAFLPTGACELAPEQLLLDCVLDAAFPDGSADCLAESTDPQAEDLRSRRGKLDPFGCRGTLTAGGAPSLEHVVRESADATGVTRLQALDALMQSDPADYGTLRLRSQLRVVTSNEDGTFYTWHRLQAVSFPRLNRERWISLADLGAAPLGATSLPCTRSLGPPPIFTIPPHGLSLQPGGAAFRAAWETHLEPVGLPPDPRLALPLVIASYGGPTSAPATSGCDAVAARLCDALGEPATCWPDACAEGLSRLEAVLTAARAALPAPTTADVMFAANVALADADGDFRADGLGTPEVPATWLMTIRLGSQWHAPVSATFDATRLAGP